MEYYNREKYYIFSEYQGWSSAIFVCKLLCIKKWFYYCSLKSFKNKIMFAYAWSIFLFDLLFIMLKKPRKINKLYSKAMIIYVRCVFIIYLFLNQNYFILQVFYLILLYNFAGKDNLFIYKVWSSNEQLI